jgi:hypothetical protein
MSNWWQQRSALSEWRRRGGKSTSSLEEQWAQLAPLVAEASRQRKLALEGEEPIVQEIAAMLFREDPIGIACWTPDDEYEPEAETIAVWLLRAKHLDLDDVRRRVHEDFVQWFGAEVAGEPARYDSIAHAVLAIWHRHIHTGPN